MTYRILDLFCGAGGAAVGYHRAGFEVVGIDVEPQWHYPFRFGKFDALWLLRSLMDGDRLLFGPSEAFGLDAFRAIHASPPCQAYSVTKHIHGGKTDYPRLIGPVRELLIQTGLPYVIENVPGSELRDPAVLCGSQFGLIAAWRDDTVYLQRHRWFEASFPIPQPMCDHSAGVRAVTVAGHGRPDVDPARGAYFAGRGYAQLTREVMGIDWMRRDELAEAIPPAYTEYIGKQLIAYLDSTSNREAA